MPQVKITASPKVGTFAFSFEGDLVVLADGAVIDAGAWEVARSQVALAPHIARGRLSAAPHVEDESIAVTGDPAPEGWSTSFVGPEHLDAIADATVEPIEDLELELDLPDPSWPRAPVVESRGPSE